MRRFRRSCSIIIGLMLLGAALVMSPLLLRAYTALQFDDQIYSASDVPSREVAIVFGARVMPNRRPSAMLYDRIKTGVDLYHAGKVDRLLMSGDSRSPEYYDETGVMRAVAIQMGVPPDAILVDPAGLRTYESCRRARDTFGLDGVILVTQNFHLDRALMLCAGMGLDAVGVAADYQRPWGYSERTLGWSHLREIPATTVALLDLMRGALE